MGLNSADEGLIHHGRKLDHILSAAVRVLRELLDESLVLGARRGKDVKVRKHGRAVYAHVEGSRSLGREVGLAHVQPHGVRRVCREARYRIGEGTDMGSLVHGHGRGIGHTGRTDRVRVIDGATAREVGIRHKRADRRSAAVNRDAAARAGGAARRTART